MSLRLSSSLIASIYFVLEFTIGVIIIIINPESYKLTLVLQITLLGVCLIVLFGNLITNQKIINSLNKTKEDRNYIDSVTNTIKVILSEQQNEAVTNKLNKLYDLVHSSRLKTNDKAILFETEIEARIANMERNMSLMSIDEQLKEIDVLINMANKRNLSI